MNTTQQLLGILPDINQYLDFTISFSKDCKVSQAICSYTTLEFRCNSSQQHLVSHLTLRVPLPNQNNFLGREARIRKGKKVQKGRKMGEGVRHQVYNILLKNIDKHYQKKKKTCLFHTALTNTLNNFQNLDGRLRTEACHHKQTKSVMTAYLNLYQRKSILPN